MNPTRRKLLLASLGAAPLSALAARVPTPRQTAGPFYPTEIPLDQDADLTRVKGHADVARGEITDLSGRILDERGHPIREARIEIWQCDAHGRYLHPGDRGGKPRDPGFQGFGHAITGTDGGYRFRTIRPVSYPGRTPHIHMAVYTWANEPFVTQMYIAGDARNEGDFLFRRIPEAHRPRVEARFLPSATQGVRFDAGFDIVLAGEHGTPSA
ncbi:MAG: intradiol ring-cleavage dioxygenase [Gammaproteobacteria bacterium]